MKISFKDINTIDINTVFPPINASLYELLSGTSLRLTEKQSKDLIKSGSFTIGNLGISKDLITQYDDPSKSTSSIAHIVNDIKTEMSEKTLFMDDLVDTISQGIELNFNVFLYGRGGHNKSEGTIDILKNLHKHGITSNDVYIKGFGDGLTNDELYGGVNVKKLMEEGVTEYNVQDSFMNHEIVIFEEFLDAPPLVLLGLKDIITSKVFRNGNQVFPIKCKTIIALTNQSKDEFNKNDSLEALMQRFQLTCKVEWDKNAYNMSNFMLLFEKVYGVEFTKKYAHKLKDLAKIAEHTNGSTDNFISPRTLVTAGKLFCNGGNLTMISEFSKDVVDSVLTKQNTNDALKYKECEEMLVYITDVCNKHGLEYSVDPALQAISVTTTNSMADKASAQLKLAKIDIILNIIDNNSWVSSLQARIDYYKQTLEQVKSELSKI